MITAGDEGSREILTAWLCSLTPSTLGPQEPLKKTVLLLSLSSRTEFGPGLQVLVLFSGPKMLQTRISRTASYSSMNHIMSTTKS